METQAEGTGGAPRREADVVVVGGGPAGCAAAIHCASRGLRTVLLERVAYPRSRPGETLHATVEEVLGHLGLRDRLLGGGYVRHEGTWIAWGGAPSFVPFGAGAAGARRGFQVPRAELDSMLLERAREVGVEVRQPCESLAPVRSNGRVTGVATASGEVAGRAILDAAGSRHWLARRLGVAIDLASPRLVARYGYVRGDYPALDAAPAFRADGGGWTWTARVGRASDRLYHWTRLSWGDDGGGPPAELAALEPVGRTRASDVTWRRVRPAAGPGYWCVGDAAALVDPAGSHGTVRALVAGVVVAQHVVAVLGGVTPERDAQASYDAWVADAFRRDTAELRAKYRSVDRSGVWAGG